MRYSGHIVASVIVAAGLAVVAGVAIGRLPADTQLPVHWGPDGAADRFADAGYALFMPVALTVLLSLAMAAMPHAEPLQDRLDQSAPLFRTAWSGLLGIMVLVEGVVAAPAFGWTPPAATVLVGVGALFVLIGNMLPKSRPGFFVGIRTPWAIMDADNWIATHRYGGRLMMGGGLAIVLVALLPIGSSARSSFVIAILGVTILTPFLYSYLYWRRTARG